MDQASDRLLLKVEKLTVVYKKVMTAIQGVSLKVQSDNIVALLGNNGAGKTTTLRAISGFLGMDDARVVEGFVEIRGERIQNRPASYITKKGIVLVPERDKVFENLTVEENLIVCMSDSTARTHRKDLYNLIFDYFPPLKRVKTRMAGYLSGGERQMLTLSSALMCEPRLLLVDELSLGLGPIIVSELMKLLKTIQSERKFSVLLVEQNAFTALEIAEHGYVMENGRIVLADKADKLRNNEKIQLFYLGQGARESRRSYRDVKQYRRTRRWFG